MGSNAVITVPIDLYHLSIYKHVYIYIYVCVYIYMSVCVELMIFQTHISFNCSSYLILTMSVIVNILL